MGVQEKIKRLPRLPGVYLMKDSQGRLIYIGKAASLRNRVFSYFGKGALTFKTAVLVSRVKDVDFIPTATEEEALLLEAALVKEKQPKFNVMLKDDKRYPLLKLTVNEEFPRLFIARRKKKDGALYFGPYTNAGLLRKALKFMRTVFPLRMCRGMPKSVCLDYHIGRCPAPCIKKIEKAAYDSIVCDVRLFLSGKKKRLIENLLHRMQEASGSKNFEEAARLRDQIQALTCVGRKRQVFTETLKRQALKRREEIEQLQSVLGLKVPPVRIDAFDISNIFGREAVGSMVSFSNGAADKSNYKRFRIKGVSGIDDYKMLQEVIWRRYKRVKEEGLYVPDLIIVDGGKAHVSCAKKVLDELGLKDIAIVGISKQLEQLHLPDKDSSIRLGASSKALRLIQRIRDEAHRFAQGYHHILRGKITSRSQLDQIPGIGPERKKALIKHFSSIRTIRDATLDELKKVETIDEKTAKSIVDYFSK